MEFMVLHNIHPGHNQNVIAAFPKEKLESKFFFQPCRFCEEDTTDEQLNSQKRCEKNTEEQVRRIDMLVTYQHNSHQHVHQLWC